MNVRSVQAHRIMIGKVHSAQAAQQRLRRMVAARPAVCRNVLLTMPGGTPERPTDPAAALASLSLLLPPAAGAVGPAAGVALEFDLSQESVLRAAMPHHTLAESARAPGELARAEIVAITWQDAPLQASEEADAIQGAARARLSERQERSAAAVVHAAHALGFPQVDRALALALLADERRALVRCRPRPPCCACVAVVLHRLRLATSPRVPHRGVVAAGEPAPVNAQTSRTLPATCAGNGNNVHASAAPCTVLVFVRTRTPPLLLPTRGPVQVAAARGPASSPQATTAIASGSVPAFGGAATPGDGPTGAAAAPAGAAAGPTGAAAGLTVLRLHLPASWDAATALVEGDAGDVVQELRRRATRCIIPASEVRPPPAPCRCATLGSTRCAPHRHHACRLRCSSRCCGPGSCACGRCWPCTCPWTHTRRCRISSQLCTRRSSRIMRRTRPGPTRTSPPQHQRGLPQVLAAPGPVAVTACTLRRGCRRQR